MTRHVTLRCALGALMLIGTFRTSAAQQSRSPSPLPAGRRIEAQDGDTIVVEDNARAKVLRRRHARVRAAFNPSEHWLIVLASYPRPDAPAAGLQVDETFTFSNVTGDWPFATRWEGDAIVEQYSLVGEDPRLSGFGLETPEGRVQLFGIDDAFALFTEPMVVATLSYRGVGRGGSRGSFDEVEQQQTALATYNTRVNAQLPPGAQSTLSVGGAVGGGVIASAGHTPPHVGGGIGPPRKIHDVAPTLPETARQAGIRGTVILELTIGIDGSVVDARVLRSIPALDAAALECVRQWRYEPVLLNGTPVPVVMTATVTFQ